MKVVNFLLIPLVVAFAISGSVYSEQPGSASSGSELAVARQFGWHAAMNAASHLATSKQPGFPGIDGWLNDFGKQTKGLDPKADPEKWPKVDVDALATHNPNFWRAYYEIAPGDPGAAFLYAGLLLGCGECTRAENVMEFQHSRPGMPPGVRKAFGELFNAAKTGGRKSEALVEAGIKLFDKGDYPGAIDKYHEALKLWPQNGWAYYELAYTLRIQQLIAAGEKPVLPAEGIVMRINNDQDMKVKYSAEAKAAYAQCRRYYPFMYEAYAGDDPDVIRGLRAVTGKIMPAMKYVRQKPDAADVDEALEKLAEGCQEANVHEFALVARQILVARRGRYDPADHPFIAASLRKLVPGPDTEAVLERLAGKTATFHRLIAIEDQVSSQAPEKMFTLGTPQYIQEKDAQDTFIFVAPIQVQKPEYFEKPGLKLAYVVFDGAVKSPPNDLKFDEGSYVLKTDKDGTRDLLGQVRSVQQGVSGKVQFFLVPPQYKSVGKKGVLRIGLRSPPDKGGLPDKDIGLFVLDDKMQPGSNVVILRKSDFVIGNSEAVFKAAVAKIPASD